MSALSIVLLALAMSTDAFAAAIGKGTALDRPRWTEALRSGAIFGVIEALTPLVGWAIGAGAAAWVQSWDHWIAFALLAALGTKMVHQSLRTIDDDADVAKSSRHSFWSLALTGVATSIDALAVGVGLAFVDVSIVVVAAAIGCTTFVAVTAGVLLGRVLGAAVGRRAELVGGLILIGVGATIVAEHLWAAA
jgi:putative Mn2+ efflux pump MntP